MRATNVEDQTMTTKRTKKRQIHMLKVFTRRIHPPLWTQPWTPNTKGPVTKKREKKPRQLQPTTAILPSEKLIGAQRKWLSKRTGQPNSTCCWPRRCSPRRRRGFSGYFQDRAGNEPMSSWILAAGSRSSPCSRPLRRKRVSTREGTIKRGNQVRCNGELTWPQSLRAQKWCSS